MHTRMDMELVNFINSDLKWKEKGQRSRTRCPRKPGASSFRLGVQLVNTIQDSAVLGTKKSGVAKKVANAPIKKRRLLRQSPSPPPEDVLPPPLQTITPQHEESGQRVVIKHASGQRDHSKSLSKSWEMKSDNGMMNSSDLLKLTKKERFDPDDLSGIQLLAAAACSCSLSDGAPDHVKESSMAEEHTTPRGDPYAVAVEETTMSIESDGLSLPVAQTLPDNDNGNEEGEKKHTLSKTLRLHWDLNTVMDEWEEPCDELLVDSHSHKTHSEGVPFIDENVSTQCNNGASLGKIYEEAVSAIICKTSDGTSKSDVVNSLIHTVKCEELSTSTSPILRGQATVKVESDTISDLPKSDGQLVSEEVVQGGCGSLKSCKSESENKHTSEDPPSDCCGSNVTQEEEGNTPEKVEGGYDSPFEDGELREEKGVEEKNDCTYYESEDDLGPMFGKVEVSHTLEDGNFLLEKEVQKKNKMVGGRGFEAVSKEDTLKRSHVKLVESEYASGKFFSERKKQYDESRYFKGNSSSAFFDLRKNDKTRIRRSRSDFHFRGLSGQRMNSSVGAWDLSSSHEYRMPKRFIGDSAVRPGGSSNQSPRGLCLYKTYKSNNHEPFIGDSGVGSSSFDTNQSLRGSVRSSSFDINRSRNAHLKGLYKSYKSDRKTPPVRGLSRDRSGFHQKGPKRVSQEESDYLDRKVDGFSPNFNRSRSPIAWNFQKRRNMDG